MRDASSDDDSSSTEDSSAASSEDEETSDGEPDEAEQMNIADSIDLKIGSDGVSAIAFHSTDRRLACGTLEGRVRIYDAEGNLGEPLTRGRYHKCVRCVSFHGQSHNLLLSGSSLGAYKVHDARTGGLVATNNKAHSCGINCLLSVNPDQFVSGDEDGHLSLFDLRNTQSAVYSVHVQADWRPPGAEDDDGNPADAALPATAALRSPEGLCGVAHLSMLPGHLLAACEDGTVTTVSLNKRKILMKSEFFGHPLTSVWPIKSGTKVAAATEAGSLLLFNRRELSNLSDKCSLLEPVGIEAACPVGQDVLLCACTDGRLQAVSLFPHARLACLGRQPTDSGACLRVCADPTGALVASASPESSQIRLWSASRLPELAQRQADRQRLNPSRRKRRAGQGLDSAAAPGGKAKAAAAGKRKKQHRGVGDAGEAASFLAGLVGGGESS